MNASATAPLSVLRFWRDLEVFNIPTAPSAKDSSDQVKIVTLRRGDVLPWQHPHFQPTQEHGYVHVVYVGVADTEDLSRLMLQSVFPDEDLSERERQRAVGNGWLAAFVANEDGHPKLDSYLRIDALIAAARFWLDRGVDGFRLDALNFAMHDPALTDNPPAPDDGKLRTRPFDFQQHLYNQSHAAIPAFIERIRGLCDQYGAVFTMAEVSSNDFFDASVRCAISCSTSTRFERGTMTRRVGFS